MLDKPWRFIKIAFFIFTFGNNISVKPKYNLSMKAVKFRKVNDFINNPPLHPSQEGNIGIHFFEFLNLH